MRRIDLIVGVILALFVFKAYAQQGVVPDPVVSQISETETSFIGARMASGRGTPCSLVPTMKQQVTLLMAWLSSIGSSRPSPSLPISM